MDLMRAHRSQRWQTRVIGPGYVGPDLSDRQIAMIRRMEAGVLCDYCTLWNAEIATADQALCRTCARIVAAHRKLHPEEYQED